MIHVSVAILNLLLAGRKHFSRVLEIKQILVDVISGTKVSNSQISYNTIERYVSPAELSTTNFAFDVTVYGLEKSITLSQKKTFSG